MSGAASVEIRWAGDGRFDATRTTGATGTTGSGGSPAIRLDSSGATGPSPVDGLLAALASCVSVDVVEILTKRRTPPSSYTVHVRGERADTIPRRLTHVALGFVIGGDGIERVHAERAIDLAVTKYCSVRDSLRDDIPVTWTVTIAGEPAAEQTRETSDAEPSTAGASDDARP